MRSAELHEDMDAQPDPPRASIGPEHAPPIPPELSRLPEKRALFGVDTYFRESWEDLVAMAGPRAFEIAHAHGLLMLKADAVARRLLEPALEWLERLEARIVAAERCRLDRHITRAMWQFQWNSATRERRDLADLLTVAGESLLVIVRLPDDPVPATVRLSSLKGPADPARREPHHLRTILGYGNFLLNYVHAADEPADLVRELGILFGAERRRAVYDALIRGADASDVARRHAADLYAEIPAVDVTLDTTLANVRRQLAERNGHGEPSAPSDWRELSRRARDAGAPLSLWEEIVIGTHLMEHTEPGLSQILGGVSVDDWGGRS